MAERIIKIIIPLSYADGVMNLLKGGSYAVWQEEKDSDQSVISVLSDLEETEKVTDLLRQKFGSIEGFHMVVQAVEASISPADEGKKPPKNNKIKSAKRIVSLRVSREELYTDIQDGTRLSHVFIVMTTLSTIVAAIGLLGNNVAVIIGAMVIAPLLGPNVALALAVTLADMELGREAVKTFSLGSLIAFCLCLLIGFILDVNPAIPEIASRTTVGLADIVLALAAGCAGVFAFTTGASGTLIGVMVAVALLPPLAVCGILLGAGHVSLACRAFLLFACNVICVNLAGVLTFYLQGIRPRTWWEADRAKRATRKALLFWLIGLAVLSCVILLITK